MSKVAYTKYCCDNELTCSSEQDSGHGLPHGWFALTYMAKDDKQYHRHYCSIQCLIEAAKFAESCSDIVSAFENYNG